ncbi:hypothetical protein EAE96_002046 [Botrytis aclada]|nr:hypothetical protein EAE96_002046 [Botrytis aclada]
MKAGVLAVAAAIAGGVNARDLGRRHGHQDFHERGLLATGAPSSESCGCTTVWSTVTGEPQLYFPPAPTAASSSVVSPAPSSATSAEGLSSVPAASAPGSSAPAPSAPAASAPGSSAPGSSAPAPSAPATSKPVSTAPAATAPGSSAPGSSAPGSSAPAASAPGSSAPAPSAPAASAPGSSAPAPSAPASSAPATSKPVSTAPAATAPAVVPTPLATTCPTPGVYTIPATTVTLTESTTVCGATSTGLPSAGTYTVGGVTTVVTTATTVVCPYAAVTTSEGVVTSTILTTTYVCPSAGTYTINPLTTTVTEPAVWVYPTPASYAPGTYTQPEVVTTVTETNVVIFCPYSSSYSTIVDATSPASTPAQATSAPAPVTTSVVVSLVKPSSSSVYVAPSSSVVSVAPSSSAVSVVLSSSATSSVASPSASSTSSSSAGNGGSVGSSGKQWAMTYSPYQDSGSCKTAAEVSVDVALIAAKGFTAIRIYSTDCSGLENVGNAAKLAGIKMIVGIFISETGCSGAADQVTELIAWGQWSLVELIVVGNEAVFGGHTTASELAAFISSSRSSFKSAGYTGQITTTEPLNIWQENTSVLCSAVDITGANLHPFFNAEVTAENAGKFALSQLELADSICPGLTAINLECGWPSAGTCNGAACPGVEEQKTAVSSIIESCGGRAAIFSYTNDLWKQPGGFGCEQSWGSIHLF